VRGKIIAVIVAFVLQFSFALWIVATIWAILARRNANNERRLRESWRKNINFACKSK
jgi:hypothetical protein